MKARRRLALLSCVAVALLLPSCQSDGHLSLFGYQMGQDALYDCSIHTVRVPIFKNNTFSKGLEFELTRAVVREIEAKTPYKVVGPDQDADSELTGNIVSFTKNTLNVNQLNEIREQETVLTVELTWKDLRTGQFLSDPNRRPNIGPGLTPVLPGGPPLASVPGVAVISAPTAPGTGAATLMAPGQPLGPDGKPLPPPVALGPDGNPLPPTAGKVIVTSIGDFIPELGQSLTSAQQENVDRLAVQIVSMMEKPW